MALDTNTLRTSLLEKIKETLDSPIDEKSSSDEVKRRFAEMIANAVADSVEVWIKTATVTVQAGIPVSTSGGAGATSSTGVGTIS